MSASTLISKQVANFSQGALKAVLYLPGATAQGPTPGYIGCLESGAQSQSQFDAESAARQRIAFLQAAKQRLFALGAQQVIGPIDGDTWHRYRLPLAGATGLTFLEPSYPTFTSGDFIAAGMPVIATYSTSVVTDLRLALEKLTEAETLDQSHLLRVGVKIRCIRLRDFESELERLYQFSIEAFKHNFLYTDIDPAAFKMLYRPLVGLLREELVLLAQEDRADGKLLGVVLVVPDQADRSAVIVKTLARHSAAPRGLGRYMFYEVLARAHQLGYSKALCALYKDNNFSAFLPEQIDGKVIRKFALFGCDQ